MVEENLIKTQLIQAEQTSECSRNAARDAFQKLRSRPYLRPILNGLESIEKVIKHLKENGEDEWVINGYHGVAGSFISCNNSDMELAVSVALGNKIFHHIVGSANVAKKLLYWMNLLKLPGEANFMALDILIVQDFTYPQSRNAKALIELVKFPDQLELAYKVYKLPNFRNIKMING